MRANVRRAVLGLTSLALVSGSAVAAPAQAANPPSRGAAGWVSGQLQDGLIQADGWAQYGPTLDILFATQALGVRAGARQSILDAFESQVDSYVGAGSESYAGATGKLVAALQAQGVDPAAYGPGDLLDRLRARVRTADDAQRGRASDQSAWGDYSNTLGQSWVVRALAGAGDPLTESATEFLLKQQCAAGFFRESMGASDSADAADFACDTAADPSPSVDATALAVLALRSAQAGGLTGVGDDIRDALAWLRTKQRGSGAFVGNGVPNANSTGLAAWALSTSRWKGSAGTASAWLRKLQVTNASAAGTALEGDTGAVAYNRAAFEAGEADGTAGAFMQWVLATAQSAVGLDALLPAQRLGVGAPARALRGDRVRVRITGLAAGERYTVRRGAKKVATGWASAKGVAVERVLLPRRGDIVLAAQGSRASRAGKATVRVR